MCNFRATTCCPFPGVQINAFDLSNGIVLVKFLFSKSGRLIMLSLYLLPFPANMFVCPHILPLPWPVKLKTAEVIHPSSCKAVTLVLPSRVFSHLTKTNPRQAPLAEARPVTYCPLVLSLKESDWTLGKLGNCAAFDWSLFPSTNMFGMSWPK